MRTNSAIEIECPRCHGQRLLEPIPGVSIRCPECSGAGFITDFAVAYMAGASIKDLANVYDISIRHMRTKLVEEGVTIRNRGPRPQDADDRRKFVEQLWVKGHSVGEIRGMVKVSTNTIARDLRVLGISAQRARRRASDKQSHPEVKLIVSAWDAGEPGDNILAGSHYINKATLRVVLHRYGRRGPWNGSDLIQRRAAARATNSVQEETQ